MHSASPDNSIIGRANVLYNFDVIDIFISLIFNFFFAFDNVLVLSLQSMPMENACEMCKMAAKLLKPNVDSKLTVVCL